MRTENNKKGVFVNINGIAKFKETQVLCEENGNAIIKEDNTSDNNLLLYDEVITKGKDLYDGKLLD